MKTNSKIFRFSLLYPEKIWILMRKECWLFPEILDQLNVMLVICLKLNYRKKVFFFLIHLFASNILLMKKLEIEETKTTTYYSTFKTDIMKMGLVFFWFQTFSLIKVHWQINWWVLDAVIQLYLKIWCHMWMLWLSQITISEIRSSRYQYILNRNDRTTPLKIRCRILKVQMQLCKYFDRIVIGCEF